MIEENIARIKERIGKICNKAGNNPEEITIVAVSKGRTAEEIEKAVSAGTRHIGENRVQEAIEKYEQLADLTNSEKIRWHMIGHLQSNKAKQAVKIFDLIHSIDTLKIAGEINRQAGKINKIQDILLEINTSQEASKFGFKPEETIHTIKEISEFASIKIKGLMAIAPEGNSEEARNCFRMLKELMEKINNLTNHLAVLSMGMTDDFEIAIEEGSTMIRLGRAIFSQT